MKKMFLPAIFVLSMTSYAAVEPETYCWFHSEVMVRCVDTDEEKFQQGLKMIEEAGFGEDMKDLCRKIHENVNYKESEKQKILKKFKNEAYKHCLYTIKKHKGELKTDK